MGGGVNISPHSHGQPRPRPPGAQDRHTVGAGRARHAGRPRRCAGARSLLHAWVPLRPVAALGDTPRDRPHPDGTRRGPGAAFRPWLRPHTTRSHRPLSRAHTVARRALGAGASGEGGAHRACEGSSGAEGLVVLTLGDARVVDCSFDFFVLHTRQGPDAEMGSLFGENMTTRGVGGSWPRERVGALDDHAARTCDRAECVGLVGFIMWTPPTSHGLVHTPVPTPTHPVSPSPLAPTLTPHPGSPSSLLCPPSPLLCPPSPWV